MTCSDDCTDPTRFQDHMSMEHYLRATDIIDWKHPDILIVFADPLPIVIDALQIHSDWQTLHDRLPDLDLISS
jgi:hypothetical protein